MEKVARAVAFAHGKGILHRDLKPSNVLLEECGEPMVSDFGLAKFLDASVELTQAGQRMGTPAYMAPEQASGQTDRVGPVSDVWALGVILYELLAGRRPFTATERDELTKQILSTDPPSPRLLRPDLDEALQTVVLKCLAKEPRRRYASAAALADDLARWLRGEPISARPESWPRRAWRRARRTVTGPAWWPVLVLLPLLGGVTALTLPAFAPAVAPDPPPSAGTPSPEVRLA